MSNIRRGPPGGAPVEKPKDFRKAMIRLAAYMASCMGGYKWVIFAVWIVAAISAMLGVLGPAILGRATDTLVEGMLSGGVNFARIRNILLTLAAIYGASSVLNYTQAYIMAGVSVKITQRLRSDVSAKIHKLPFQYFDRQMHGDVLSRITNDIDTIQNTLNQSMAQIISAVTAAAGIFIVMFILSPVLMAVSTLILPLSAISLAFIMKRSQKYFSAQQKHLGGLNGHVEETFSCHTIVKACCGEKKALEGFDRQNEELYNAGWKAAFLSGLMWPVVIFIGNLNYVAICIIGGSLTVAGAMTIGGIQAFIQYSRRFGQVVSELAGIAAVLQQTAAACERVFAVLSEAEEVSDEVAISNREPLKTSVFRGFLTRAFLGEAQKCTAEVRASLSCNELALLRATSENPQLGFSEVANTESGQIKGCVEFENVTFGYDPQNPVLRRFSAKIEAGQKIAIVGHTGAGKTTIVKLLLRFYDVDEGSITVDGTDIRRFSRSNLRSRFGMVLQDSWLFSGTIADNIRYGRLCATDENVRRAAIAARADGFIRALPDGYQMIISEDADNISAGQKQLITIARTILADPQMIILDEATSHVDTRTELFIQDAMDNLMHGRTSFIIAHRLSTIRGADVILVMNRGNIAELGTHGELLAKGGVYADLYNSQRLLQN